MEHNLKPPGEPKTTSNHTLTAHAGSKKNLLWLLFGVVVILLLIVLLVLPSIVSKRDSAQRTAVIAASQMDAVQPAPKELPQTETSTNQLRIDAEHALQDFLRLLAQPDLENAEVWSPEAWFESLEASEQGDTAFGQGKFAAALRAYESAGIVLQTILNDRDQTQQGLLMEAEQLLENNAISDATFAFERVLAMQPGNQQAQLGIERASVRAELLDLMSDGHQAEIAAQPQLAAQTYLAALQLDSDYVPAQEALKEIENELGSLAFQKSMGQALQALDNGRFASAEKALNEAAKLRPNDQTVQDVRRRLNAARRQDNLSTLRVESEKLVDAEDWAGASQAYRKALKIDPTASFANIGLPRAEKRQKLNQEFDHYLANTTRLYSEEPLENARQLLAANTKIESTEPLLAAKAARLQEAIRLALLPVDLLIISDNLTEVTIYKVGRLGSFGKKQLSLKPGKYTITGSRNGYRDVLKVIELNPGNTGQTLEILSGEAI